MWSNSREKKNNNTYTGYIYARRNTISIFILSISFFFFFPIHTIETYRIIILIVSVVRQIINLYYPRLDEGIEYARVCLVTYRSGPTSSDFIIIYSSSFFSSTSSTSSSSICDSRWIRLYTRTRGYFVSPLVYGKICPVVRKQSVFNVFMRPKKNKK